MDALVIGKWLSPKNMETIWDPENPDHIDEYNKIRYAPPIITTMVDMFLNLASNEDTQGNKSYDYVFGE